MTTPALEDARALFAANGLPFPPIPVDLQPSFRKVDEWCYASRPVEPRRMYAFDTYPSEAVREPVADYAALSHAGQGANSYSLNYDVVYGPLALFLQVGWGGINMDTAAQVELMATYFTKAAALLAAAARGREPHEHEGGRLIVADSDFRGVHVCGWLDAPTGDESAAKHWLSEHEVGEDALDAALAWF